MTTPYRVYIEFGRAPAPLSINSGCDADCRSRRLKRRTETERGRGAREGDARQWLRTASGAAAVVTVRYSRDPSAPLRSAAAADDQSSRRGRGATHSRVRGFPEGKGHPRLEEVDRLRGETGDESASEDRLRRAAAWKFRRVRRRNSLPEEARRGKRRFSVEGRDYPGGEFAGLVVAAAGGSENSPCASSPFLSYVPASRGYDPDVGTVGDRRRRDDGTQDVRPVYTRQLIRRRLRGTKEVIM